MSVFHPIKSLRGILRSFEQRLILLQKGLDLVQEALGRIEARQMSGSESPELSDHEFRVFSQWGEDGIIQFLLRHIPIKNKTFVEFGVEDYTQANTRFLLVNNNWHGLVLDSDSDNIAKIKNTTTHSYYDLKAFQAFVTKDNINEILKTHGVVGEIGLLSIDIDGNDFWVWRAIDVIDPVIVVIEYNHRFGKDAAVTVPYEESFNRFRSSRPLVYFGASLKALCLLGERKGYAFVGCNSNGVNAFFVRKDKKPDRIRELSAEEGFVAGNFSELRDAAGNIVKSTPEAERQMIMSLPLANVADLE
jgi:methyltransferase FkbM-like protein